jgi:hypothetical protein
MLVGGHYFLAVTPAKAGVQGAWQAPSLWPLDPGFRRDDGG